MKILNRLKYNKTLYDVKQLEQIRLGLEDGIDVAEYDNPNYDFLHMEVIRLCIKRKVDIPPAVSSGVLSSSQIQEIRLGLLANLDISYYAYEYYDNLQMKQIREGLFKGLNVSIYASTVFNYEQMLQIRLGMEQKLPIEKYANPEYSGTHMLYIRICMHLGKDAFPLLTTDLELEELESVFCIIALGSVDN